MTKPTLLKQMRNVIRLHHYSHDTERAYLHWAKRFILFHGKTHPRLMGKVQVEAFLSHLAVNRCVSPSTQNIALSSVLFLYQKVLELDLPWLDDVVRAKPKKRIPVVLSTDEVLRLFEHCPPSQSLAVKMLYASGLRLMECLRLRIGDIDFSRHSVRVHAGKGGKDRLTVLSEALVEPLETQITWVKSLHKLDRENGLGEAKLPDALLRKFGKTSQQFYWQFLFPSRNVTRDPRDPSRCFRWHVHRSQL